MQADYMKLTAGNFVSSQSRGWCLLTPMDKANIGSFRFEAFFYVRNMAPPPAKFHRATQGRDQQARLQWMAHGVANAVEFGPIAAHHLDIVNKSRPDNSPFEVPVDNTTAKGN